MLKRVHDQTATARGSLERLARDWKSAVDATREELDDADAAVADKVLRQLEGAAAALEAARRVMDLVVKNHDRKRREVGFGYSSPNGYASPRRK